MATVYRAIQEGPLGFEPEVALKLFDPSLVASQPAVVGMIVDEARIASRIKHPGVVRILDLVEDDGQLYTVMDCIDGPSMRQILDSCRLARRTADTSAIVAVIAEACEGLHAAHTTPHPDGSDTGLVHRDVKPGNILLTAKGEVRLSDFGIAIFSDRIADATAQGQLKGTPAYMSPEQVFGEPMDARSDIFSMGLTLFTLCTNRLAFTGDSPMKIAVRIAEEPMDAQAAELEALLPGLGPVFARACAKEPSERYDSAALFGEALRSIYDALDNPQSPIDLIEKWRVPSSSAPPQASPKLQAINDEDEPETDTNLTPLTRLQDEPTDAPTHPGNSDHNQLNAAGAGFADLDEAPTEEIVAAPESQVGWTSQATDPQSSRTSDPPPEESSKSSETPFPRDTPVLGLKPLSVGQASLPIPKKSIDGRPQGEQSPTFPPTNPSETGDQSKAAYRPERDYRGRVIHRKPVDPKTLIVSKGEKIGVAVTAILLVLFTVIISIVHLRDQVDEEVKPSTTVRSNDPAEEQINPSRGNATDESVSTETAETTEESAIPINTVTLATRTDKEETSETGEERESGTADPPPTTQQEEPKTPPTKTATKRTKKKRIPPAATKDTKKTKAESDPTEAAGVGLLSVNTYPYSQVWVDGKLRGQTPMRALELPVGLHKVKLVFPTLNDREEMETVRIQNRKTSKLVRRIQVENETN
jgi:serine/threonine protein kinase